MAKAPQKAGKVSLAQTRQKDDEPVERDVGGRPTKLKPTPEVLKTVSGLGSIMATTQECAAVLGVSEPTFFKFLKDNPEANAALEAAQGQRKVSLRRSQIALAEKGNLGALIWLGKQYLGQRDKSDVAVDARVEMGTAAAALNARLDRALSVLADAPEDAAPEGDRTGS